MQEKSKIINLIYGNYCYDETLSKNPLSMEILGEVAVAEEKLLPKIKDDVTAIQLFDEFKNCVERLSNCDTDHYYTEGFKTGLMIGIEVGEWADNKIKY